MSDLSIQGSLGLVWRIPHRILTSMNDIVVHLSQCGIFFLQHIFEFLTVAINKLQYSVWVFWFSLPKDRCCGLHTWTKPLFFNAWALFKFVWWPIYFSLAFWSLKITHALQLCISFAVVDKLILNIRALWPVYMGLASLSCWVPNVFICLFAAKQW